MTINDLPPRTETLVALAQAIHNGDWEVWIGLRDALEEIGWGCLFGPGFHQRCYISKWAECNIIIWLANETSTYDMELFKQECQRAKESP